MACGTVVRAKRHKLGRDGLAVTFAGACFLGFITVILPIATARISAIPHQQMYLGGTAVLIVVGVALDTM